MLQMTKAKTIGQVKQARRTKACYHAAAATSIFSLRQQYDPQALFSATSFSSSPLSHRRDFSVPCVKSWMHGTTMPFVTPQKGLRR